VEIQIRIGIEDVLIVGELQENEGILMDEKKMQIICLRCEYRTNEDIINCPHCGHDDLGLIPFDKKLLRI